MQKLAVVPVPSLRMERQLRKRFESMMRWHAAAARDGKGSYAEATWKRRVDFLCDEIEGMIYLMGYNPLDHGRRPKEDA